MSGHLFIVQADMRRLAADAYLIPCDGTPSVSNVWKDMVASDGEVPGHPWFWPTHEVHGDVKIATPAGEGVTGTDGVTPKTGDLRILVDTVTEVEEPEQLADRLTHAAAAAAALVTTPRGGRQRCLIAVPLAGVGQGNFPGRRAMVVRAAVAKLLELVTSSDDALFDVAFVLLHPADYAAAQWQRHQLQANDNGTTTAFWPELSPQLTTVADRLGQLAAHGQLSVFVGAGISRPLGLPAWRELLETLSRKAGIGWNQPAEDKYLATAQEIENKDPEGFNQAIAELCYTEWHALGHALVADLQCSTMVTTNYDIGLELAAEAVFEPVRRPRVMARELALSGRPWLLKLHGDTEAPVTIVLSQSQYETLTGDRHALRGVVQTLMLTSHLLFIGFGFADDDFMEMAKAVQKVRRLADQPVGSVGTAMSLGPVEEKYPELDYVSVAEPGTLTESSARTLEIFLDRLAWRCQIGGDRSAAFVLHEGYQADANAEQIKLRDALRDLKELVDAQLDSPVKDAVDDLLARLGAKSSHLTGG